VRKQIWHVPVYPGNEFLYDTTLGPLVHFLNDNKDDWLISVPGQEYIFECLQNFAQYDRNGHFHRDNIDDTETVKRIRDNALLILYYLVGSYAPSFSLSTNEEKKERFCRMYRALQSIRSSVSNFYLQFEGGEQIKVIRLYDQPEPVYSEDGSLSESIIRFVPVDDFSTDVYGNVDRSKIQTDELLININNMPISIGFEQFSTHKVVPIVW